METGYNFSVPKLTQSLGWLLLLSALVSCGTPTGQVSAPPTAPLWPTDMPTVLPPTVTRRPPPTPTPVFATAPPTFITRRVPVLEYHYSTFDMGQVEMRPEWFAAQMQWLAENDFTVLTLDEFRAFLRGDWLPPARAVLLTFDVGVSKFDDYITFIIPTLRAHGYSAVFFVMPSRVQDSCTAGETCWPILAYWQQEGLISVQSHSFYHVDYTTLPPPELTYDAARAKAVIEEKLGTTVVAMCYPYDAVNPAAYDLLPALGYEFAMGGATRPERSVLSGDAEPFNLPRYYPYSNAALYPVLTSSHGQTFAEMLLSAVTAEEK